MSRKELENQMGSLREKHQRDAASLKSQLSEAESQAKDVQKEVTWNMISALREYNVQLLRLLSYKKRKNISFLLMKIFRTFSASTSMGVNSK